MLITRFMNKDQIIKDSQKNSWVERMPEALRPYLRLSRYDRPIGFWLLALPGFIGICFAELMTGFLWEDIKWAVLIGIGAIAMRGAGCTYNDIIDRDLDAKVERTAMRPLPAGSVSVKQAWAWLVFQCLIGLIVLLFFPRPAQITALFSLVLVAAYPFMKRITFWPQAWLGLTFNWAVLVAYRAKTYKMEEVLTDPMLAFFNTSLASLFVPILLLYAGLVLWTIGYDTIYACQDIEDDALIGVKSTARLFGDAAPLWVLLVYILSFILVFMAVKVQTSSLIAFFTLLPFGLHLYLQILQLLFIDDPEDFLSLFKSNRNAGLLLIAGLILAVML